MDLMINPALSGVRIKVDDEFVEQGEKVIVNKTEGEEMLGKTKWGKPLWVEFEETTMPAASDDEDNSEGE